MSNTRLFTLAGALLLGTAAAHATWYTNEADFVAAIDPTYYLEEFDGFSDGVPLDGSQTTWDAPGGNGYGWTASAVNGLYSFPSEISTNLPNDPLDFTFTGNTVPAFGGQIGNTDIHGALIPGVCTITLSDNTTHSIDFSGATDGFLAWAGPQAIASVELTSTSGESDNYVKLSHAYTGTVPVPEPVTASTLALGVLALLRRRRDRR